MLTMVLLCPTHGLITSSKWTMRHMDASCCDENYSDPDARAARLTFVRDYTTSPLWDDTQFFWTPKEFRELMPSSRLDLVFHFQYVWPEEDAGKSFRYEHVRIREPNDEARVQLWFDDDDGQDHAPEDVLTQEILLGLRARNNREERMSVGVPITLFPPTP